MQKFWWLKFVLFAGIFGLLVAAIWTVRVYSFVSSSVLTDGIVTSVQLSFDGEGDPTYNPIVQFRDLAGQIRSFTTFVSFESSAFQEGDHVTVLYPAHDPAQAVLNDWFELYFLPFMIALLSLMDIGAYFLIRMFARIEKDLPDLGSLQHLNKP